MLAFAAALSIPIVPIDVIIPPVIGDVVHIDVTAVPLAADVIRPSASTVMFDNV